MWCPGQEYKWCPYPQVGEEKEVKMVPLVSEISSVFNAESLLKTLILAPHKGGGAHTHALCPPLVDATVQIVCLN